MQRYSKFLFLGFWAYPKAGSFESKTSRSLSNISLVWLVPILNMLLLVHTSILTNQQQNLPYPSSLSLFRHAKMFFYVLKHLYFNMTELVERSTQNVGWWKFYTNRASEIVVPPREMLLSFSCVQLLTHYDVRERKQQIDLTILCVLKTNFLTAIK